jgi:putative addiction module component (TIGR02574 family)
MNTQSVEFQALHLPLEARAALAEQLIASLDEPSEAELEAMWLDTAQERAAELDANPNLGIPIEASLAKMRAFLEGLQP